jgi:putative polyketide hydroxylase
LIVSSIQLTVSSERLILDRMTNEQHTSVLVVGGALTGMSSAFFLAAHGVDCVVVERHPDLLLHPRLRGINPRTFEVFRQLGLEEAIRDACFADPDNYMFELIRADTLADEEYGTLEEAEGGGGLAAASPAPFAPIDQDKLEILLRAKARERGADIRFSTELLSFDAGADGVRATLRDSAGEEYTLVADYLIAADGANSSIRQALGIEVDGPGELYRTISAMVDADLNPVTRGRGIGIAYLQQPRPFTALLAHDHDGRQWVFAMGYDPERESIEDYTDERVAEAVRAAAGLPDVVVAVRPQIPGTDLKVLSFAISAQLARHFRGPGSAPEKDSYDGSGRVFLAGDAARTNPPTGGLGGNTGIQDAHNLAWKLAAVLNGQAGPELLDTYEQERRPVAELTMWQMFARFGSRMGQGAEVEMIDYDAVAMGYQYRSSAVLGAAEDAAPMHPSLLAGQPGTRAPHVELAAGRSTIDLYGKGFVLLAGPDHDWSTTAKAAAGQLGVPLETYVLDSAEARERHGIMASGALLVRPDGFVAWRAPDVSGAPGGELEQALRNLLSRVG